VIFLIIYLQKASIWREDMDTWLLEFVKENLITIGLVLAILREIAAVTPWAVDNKIIQILTGFIERPKR